MSITKEEFFAIIDQPAIEKLVDYEGKTYRIRAMTEADGIEYELMIQKDGEWDIKKARRAMICVMLLDNDGNRIVDDEARLKGMPRGLAGFLWDECQKLNGYRPGEVDDIVKKSEPVEGSN